MTAATIVVLLTDAQLADEIETVAAEVCCGSYEYAASAGCGCRGAAAGYLARLRGEAARREGEGS